MIALGAIICELFKDENWSKKLANKSSDYYRASESSGLDSDTKSKLKLMGDRSEALSSKVIGAGGSERYHKSTDALYPTRVTKRALNVKQNIERQAKAKAAKSLLPKSLQK